jgi:hypothetical protein
VGFFRRRRDPRLWTTLIAPLAGAAGLITACVLIVHNYSALTGKTSGLINQLPWLLAGAALAAFAYSLWLRSARPALYAGIGEGEAAPVAAERARQLTAEPAVEPAALA